MSAGMTGPWLVVVNPTAGKKSRATTGRPDSVAMDPANRDLAGRVVAALTPHAVTYELVVPADLAETGLSIADAIGRGITRFAAVGGDGTAHAVVNALLAHRWSAPPVLAILPAGSGSDFIRTFALPRRLEASAALLATPEVYRCDVGYVEGSFGARYFLNALNLGVAAAGVRVGEKLPRRLGGLRYTLGFWLALPGFPPAPVEVDLGRRKIAADALNVVVANGQFFGGGLNVAPQASVMDGVVDVEVFAYARRQAFSVMPRVIRGNHLRHPGVKRGRLTEGTVTVPAGWPVEADGELLGHGTVTVRVVPAAIDFKI